MSVLLMALVAAAWLVLWASQQSPLSSLTHSTGHSHSGLFTPEASVLTLAGTVPAWTLMVAAMMLPSAFSFIVLFDVVAARQVRWRRWSSRLWPVALLLVGYSCIWMLFGIVGYLGSWGLATLMERVVGSQDGPKVILQATLVLAGLYQFTPLKRRSHSASCTSTTWIEEQWDGRGRVSAAFSLGMRYGVQCLGSCGALMLLMFTEGGHDLALMLVLGIVTMAEKNTEWAARLSRSMGAFLIGIALTLAWSSVVGVSLAHAHS